MAKENKGRGVDRLLKRGTARTSAIGLDQLPRAVQRVTEREGGIALSGSSSKGSVSAAQPASTPSHQGGPDMRSELVRKVVEMAQLQRSRDLLQQAQRAKALAKASAEGSGGAPTLEEWCSEMKASGLSDAEIEDHMAQRLRAVRNGMLDFQHLRSVGGGN